MFNRLAVIVVAISVFSLSLLFSGFTPNLNLNARISNENPKPRIYSVNEYGDLLYKNSNKKNKVIASGTIKTPILLLDKDSYQCLQKNIYFEARDQNVFGQLMVGVVTLSRVNWANSKRYPDSICSVVFQRKQFSWANNGVRTPVLNNNQEKFAWILAGWVAETSNIAYSIGLDKLFSNVTHYHKDTIAPKWSKSDKLVEIGKIGRHIFYSEST